MATFLGAIKGRDKAYLQYDVKGKKKRFFFPSTTEAIRHKNQFLKNIKQGVYRETFSNIIVKSI